MNREIKFRCWDTTKKAMFYQKDEALGTFFDHTVYPIVESKIIQQYTGLKDKNGKEIYEGDILTATYCGSEIRYKNTINWQDESCAFEFAGSPMWTWEDVEIIGNIYQDKK